MEERMQDELIYSVTNTIIPILTDAGVPHGYNQTIPTPTNTTTPTTQQRKPGDTDGDWE